MSVELPLIEFAVKLVDKVSSHWFDLRQQQKTDTAEYLGSIADVLLKFGPAYRQRDTDTMNTLLGETHTLATRFGAEVGNLPKEDIDNFVNKLSDAFNSKDSLARISNSENVDKEAEARALADIAQIAGLFRGVSLTLKATVHSLR